MANKIKAKLALQLREAGVSANKVYAAHRMPKKSQKEVLEAAADLGNNLRRRRGPAGLLCLALLPFYPLCWLAWKLDDLRKRR